jgi:hypothetical protein
MYSFLFRIKKIDFIEYRQGGGIGGYHKINNYKQLLSQ